MVSSQVRRSWILARPAYLREEGTRRYPIWADFFGDAGEEGGEDHTDYADNAWDSESRLGSRRAFPDVPSELGTLGNVPVKSRHSGMKFMKRLLFVAMVISIHSGIGRAQEPTSQTKEIADARLEAGVDFNIMRPFAGNNVAYNKNDGFGLSTQTTRTTEFGYGYQLAPSTWFAVIGPSGFGFRFRFFEYDEASRAESLTLTTNQSAVSSINPPRTLGPILNGNSQPFGFSSPGVLLTGGTGIDKLTFRSDLRVQHIDFEGIYEGFQNDFSWSISGGARYLQTAQNYRADLVNASGEIGQLRSGHDLYGAGPTIAFGAQHRLGGGFTLFGNLRGSFVLGVGRQDAYFFQSVNNPAQTTSLANVGTFTQTLPIFDAQVGGEYTFCLGNYGHAFVRAAAVTQSYFDLGTASSRSGNLSLFGGQVSLGWRY